MEIAHRAVAAVDGFYRRDVDSDRMESLMQDIDSVVELKEVAQIIHGTRTGASVNAQDYPLCHSL